MIVGLLVTDPTTSFHRACYSFTSLLISCYLVGLRADAPIVLAHFFINLLLRASLAHFPHLYLFWALLANIFVVLVYFTTSFLGLSRAIYFFFTSFTPMDFLLVSLGFLSPITTSLHFVTISAYWLLSQPIDFTNSFPELPRAIYFLFTSYYSHGLTTSFFGLSRPIYLFFTFFYSCGSASHQSCHFSSLGLLPYFFIVFFLLTFFIVGLLLLLGPLSKMGINRLHVESIHVVRS